MGIGLANAWARRQAPDGHRHRQHGQHSCAQPRLRRLRVTFGAPRLPLANNGHHSVEGVGHRAAGVGRQPQSVDHEASVAGLRAMDLVERLLQRRAASEQVAEPGQQRRAHCRGRVEQRRAQRRSRPNVTRRALDEIDKDGRLAVWNLREAFERSRSTRRGAGRDPAAPSRAASSAADHEDDRDHRRPRVSAPTTVSPMAERGDARRFVRCGDLGDLRRRRRRPVADRATCTTTSIDRCT